MTDIIIAVILVAVLIFALIGAKKRLKGGCCSGGSNVKIKPSDKNIKHYPYKAVVCIEGMSCDQCKNRVESAFNAKNGCFARVNLKKGCAEIFGKEKLSKEEIENTVKKEGYIPTKVVL